AVPAGAAAAPGEARAALARGRPPRSLLLLLLWRLLGALEDDERVAGARRAGERPRPVLARGRPAVADGLAVGLVDALDGLALEGAARVRAVDLPGALAGDHRVPAFRDLLADLELPLGPHLADPHRLEFVLAELLAVVHEQGHGERARELLQLLGGRVLPAVLAPE